MKQMTLLQFLRLISQICCSDRFLNNNYQTYSGMSRLPRIIAQDGFKVSLQIKSGNYCQSENGYRQLGYNWTHVEFGFPENLNNKSEALIAPFGECNDKHDTILKSDVGMIPTEIMEQVFEIHGGIDWESTCSIENLTN